MNFTAYGHPNITARHKTTIEFTKDKELTKKGDCIVGVKADFSLKAIKKIINKNKKIKIIIKVDDIKDTITGYVNPDFNDDKEIVIRKTDFVSKRTLMINADKACGDLDRKLLLALKDVNKKICIILDGFS